MLDGPISGTVRRPQVSSSDQPHQSPNDQLATACKVCNMRRAGLHSTRLGRPVFTTTDSQVSEPTRRAAPFRLTQRKEPNFELKKLRVTPLCGPTCQQQLSYNRVLSGYPRVVFGSRTMIRTANDFECAAMKPLYTQKTRANKATPQHRSRF